MEYFFVETRSASGDPIAEDIAVPRAFDHFYLGNRIPKPKRLPRIGVSRPHSTELPDLIQGPYTFIIASDRLRDLFAQLEPDNVQFHAVDLRSQSQRIATYHFVQVLDNLDAIDWAASDLESYPDDKYGIVKVRRLALSSKAIGKRNAFRLMGLPTDLVVSGLFRDRAVDAGLTGIRFVPVAKFRMS